MEELDLKTLEHIKFTCDLYSDSSSRTLGYNRLCELIEETKAKNLNIPVVSFELPSDDIFDKPEVSLNNPLEEFYYYERPAYLEDDQKQFRKRLQKALNYLKGN